MSQMVGKMGRLVWIDCEMTGLDHEKQRLVEIAVILTDKDLNIIAEGPDIVINQPEEVLDNMEDWSRRTFAENGLLSKIRESKIDMKQAEDMDSSRFLIVLVVILDFLANETVKQACPLAGNSVHLDRRFISKYMPRLDKHLHYRIVDVSTIKELAARWYPKEFKKAPLKRQTHRALDDIRESIEELRYYRSSIFHQ
ncbi:Oligoribonuclease, mitochondrial [Parelaphostrongylus tenuis]|uniref:Probable oligoribonuclease n=1 Tax=Parelaphostrongylus tenuis TaxID=148309 RepID=A0AAD5N194_PARTN|nr:Oligoribonuclease, mitochondrial [Parelaphostrongylus tenuis]